MRIFGDTHVGRVREMNEDFYFESELAVGPLPNLFIVADGMGGHQAGEVASRMACEAFVRCCRDMAEPGMTIEQLLKHAAGYANRCVYEKSMETADQFGMGTTLVAGVVDAQHLYVVNVGDSRLYVLDDTLRQVTIDHSYVEELVQLGQISREEASHHPAKNKITRALGVDRMVKADFFQVAVAAVEKVLLCSDGLTNMIDEKEIYHIMSQTAGAQACTHKLIQKAVEYGGYDNITVVLVDLSE